MMEDYIDIMHKIFSGEATPEERTKLEEWLAADAQNQQTFDQVRQIWERSGEYDVDNTSSFEPNVEVAFQIGRASCRERV